MQETTSTGNCRNIASRWKIWILPMIGNKRITSLTEQDVQEVVNKAYAAGKSKKTLKSLCADMRAFFKCCRLCKLSTFNPEALHIPAGATVGIIGGTGSAKTTLVQLIPRLYDATEGTVKVGGRDVRDYDLTALRDAVGIVLQKNVLFTGTVRENLQWGNPQASDDELLAACRAACVDEFLDRIGGLDGELGQGGAGVSGGQKQRLCIARTLLKHPRVLIFDDSTSAVDTRTDALIRGAFAKEIPNTTKIIIAQRIASVMDADRIVVLDDGRVTDSQGRTIDFKNTIIILTSNLGSDLILEDLEKSRAEGKNELSDEARNAIDQLLKRQFRPEFLNRLDEIVYYKSLTKDEMRKIVDLQLNDLRKRMDEGKHLKLEVTTAAKDFIIDSAYDSVYGARPIKRFIQSRVETLIAKAIIQGSYAEGSTLTVDCENGTLVLR